ncbi:MAG: hypothetical protein LBK08_10355 [Treponema sp.]|jgi:hypothetical protein|nr:hypothetical protein [Treponema sp.]
MKGKYMGIPIFFDPQTNGVKGRNAFCEFLLAIAIWLDANIIMPFLGLDDFQIEIERGQ